MHQLTHNTSEAWAPTYASNGKRIAFESTRAGGASQIFVMKDSGRAQRRLTHGYTFAAGPDFSPDGERIAFYGTRDTSFELFVMRADGTRDHSLTDDPANERAPVFSPHGNWIAFGTNDTSIEKIAR